jgi:hypothetical protein
VPAITINFFTAGSQLGIAAACDVSMKRAGLRGISAMRLSIFCKVRFADGCRQIFHAKRFSKRCHSTKIREPEVRFVVTPDRLGICQAT